MFCVPVLTPAPPVPFPGMDNKESLSSEATFFRQQPVFKGLPSSFFGVPNLTRRLTDLLVGRIKAALPSIKWEVSQTKGAVWTWCGVCVCLVPAGERVGESGESGSVVSNLPVFG